MSLVTTLHAGPVAGPVYNLKASWASDAGPEGARAVSLDGALPLEQAHQLSELVANPDQRVTVGGSMGVLEYVHFDSRVADQFVGWYLLQGFSFAPYRVGDQVRFCEFQLSAVHLGDQRTVVVSRSARTRANDFTLDGEALVANPFWGEDADGQPFLVDPGGTLFARQYDPTSPHDSARLTPTDGARSLGIQAGGVDELEIVVRPDLQQVTGGAPRWVSDRGGECRAYDRREAREVFGPSHPLVAPTDIILDNGLVQAWVGPRGLPPYLQIKAIAGGAWRELGYLHFSDPEPGDVILTSARLVRVTPDAATVALGLQGQGEVFVTLRQGERMLRVQHGSSRSPVRCNRTVRWAGLPPWTRLQTAVNGTGKFGQGIDAGRDPATWADPLATWADPGYSWSGEWLGDPDLRLRWPPPVAETAWTLPFWYRPARAAVDLAGAGLLSVYDDALARAVQLILDSADRRFKLSVGATTVQSSVQSFAASSDVFCCLRFSDELGMALSIKPGAGALEHVKNAGVTDPGTAGRYLDILFGASSTAWGDGAWGDGTWGGVSFADGVLDNLMLFDGYLTDAEVAALSTATDHMNGLPTPEARLVWHVPGDARAIPNRSAFASGRVYEATGDGGTIRSPDEWGLTKGLGLLDGSAGAIEGFSVAAYAEVLAVGAFLATTAVHDDVADHHEQFAAASEQQVMVIDA